MREHHALGVAGRARGVEQGRHLAPAVLLDRLGLGGLVQWADGHGAERTHLHLVGVMAPGVRGGELGNVDGVVHQACAAMVADLVQLALRQPRIDHHRPGVEGRGREHEGRERQAVLAHDHDAIARPRAVVPECVCRVVDDSGQVAVGPHLAVADQGGLAGRAFSPGPEDMVQTMRQSGQQLLGRGFPLRQRHCFLPPLAGIISSFFTLCQSEALSQKAQARMSSYNLISVFFEWTIREQAV